jgi:hypothetical protein
MSLTSYRAAPSRATNIRSCSALIQKNKKAVAIVIRLRTAFLNYEWVFPYLTLKAPAAMPGDALLFQRLSGSTIGAIRFHGRVRDGIGWVTDAMATKQ